VTVPPGPPDPRLARAQDPAAVPIREAATVVLVRDAAAGGLEVFLQHRVPTMQFAPGMSVFPGGGVEDRDRSGRAPWSGPGPRWWGEAFGVDEDRAAAAVRAAVREVFEETGVLLAHPGAGTGPVEADRHRLEAGETTLDELLESHGMTLAADLLRPWDRWTTPVGPPRRYDTLFFVAGLPAGAEADDGTSEARATEWLPADAALDAHSGGTLHMLPPTLAVLDSLRGVADVAGVLGTRRAVRPGGN